MVVHDPAFAAELREDLLRAMAQGAHAIQQRDWIKVPWYSRLVSWLLYGLARLLLGWLGMAKRL